MQIGVVGAPNKGKSTFFSAATLIDIGIANYPFTTVSPNKGMTYVRAPCPHVTLNLPQCNPKNSKCVNGTRFVPVNIIDVPGLVPEAHKGKGLGNQFLDSIREADALIIVVDGTGKTDLHGNPCDFSDPMADVEFLKEEFSQWLASIMQRKGAKGSPSHKDVADSLSGLKITGNMLSQAALSCGLDISDGLPDKEGTLRIARELFDMRMPLAVAFNKFDLPGARENFSKLKDSQKSEGMFQVSAAIELALRKSNEAGLTDYSPGAKTFAITGSPSDKQAEALESMQQFMSNHKGTGVQEVIDWIIYKKLGGIVVYPVEDEHRCSNRKGAVLPDAFLVRRGLTSRQLAAMVHTDLAQKFIGAMDVRRHIRVGADHELADGDVVKIIAAR